MSDTHEEITAAAKAIEEMDLPGGITFSEGTCYRIALVALAAAAQVRNMAAAREVMKQQAREADQPITERWHNHSSRAFCHRSRCPAGSIEWDGKGLVSDHFTDPAAPSPVSQTGKED